MAVCSPTWAEQSGRGITMREPWDRIVAALCGQCEELARAALEQVVEFFEPTLLGYLIRHKGLQTCDACDSVQETWCKVWLLRREVKPELGFRAWVFRIAENEAANVYRKRRGQTAWDESNPDISDQLVSREPSQREAVVIEGDLTDDEYHHLADARRRERLQA